VTGAPTDHLGEQAGVGEAALLGERGFVTVR